MGSYSELIKNFSKTRDYVRDFFICGFKVRDDFKNKSSRTYDDERRRVESWMGDCLRYENSDRGRKVAISADSGHISENPLYRAYFSRSFTDNDIRLHFFLTDILADGKKRNLREIISETDSRFGELFDEQTVRNKLKEYVAEGIFISEKIGKTAYFRLSPDTAAEFFDLYGGLGNAVRFFSETQEFGVIGNSLLKAADLRNDLFLMKHNYIVHTLEDDILVDILDAINNRRYIEIKIFSMRNSSGRASEHNVVPMQILTSLQTGRRYLCAYVPHIRRFNSYRLDSIKSVKHGRECEDYDDIMDAFKRNIPRCFGVSFGNGNEAAKPLKITFHIDEQTEKYVVERLGREKRMGTVEKTAENTFVLTLDIFDTREPMQWLKTFIGRIVEIEGGNESVREQFRSDIRRLYKMYGGDGNGDIQ